MPKVFTSKTQKKGEIGEKVAQVFLMKHGFNVIERNYTQKWGEIDIVAKKQGKLHFIEVKSVSYETYRFRVKIFSDISRETYRPEENMHPKKISKIQRTIQTYFLHRRVSHETEWQLDLVCVYLDDERRKGYCKMLENII